jgi:uncharacterized protein YcfJ
MNRFQQLAILTLSALASFGLQAQYRGHDVQENYDFARVISAQPIYETVEVDQGREVCSNQRVNYPQQGYREHRSESGSVIGAIIGGVIGNQFGSGRGRAAATVAGVALGSAVARDAQYNNARYRNDRRYTSRTERVCEYQPSYRTERQIVGYDVRYDYKGQTGHTTTRNQPGRTIRVQVAVTAIED